LFCATEAPLSRSRIRQVVAALLLAVGVVVLAVIILGRVPSSDYVFLPDRAHPVAPLVHVEGGRQQAHSRGALYFVDVFIRKATLFEQLFGGLENGAAVYPPQDVIPPGVTGAQDEEIALAEMKTSQEVAAAVALRALGRKVTTRNAGALIEEVEPGYPAADRLEPTDVIVGIDGHRISTPADVSALMKGRPIGSRVSFTVQRNGRRKTITLKTVPASKGSSRGIVGILLGQEEDIKLPINVSIDAHGIGGPSAGLAFALEVLQQLGRNVDRGLKIAATGEIFLNGSVGPIGGIEQKTIGAREAHVNVFLVPAGQNAIDARKYADGLRIIPVTSFRQALHALATLHAAG
jgi:PDZ domain-containing protein